MKVVKIFPEKLAVLIKPDPSMAVISITNPGDVARLQGGWGAMLRVSFADAQYDEDTIRFAERLWYISSRGFFTKADALTIWEFMGSLPPSISTLVVHCGAGESRSAAVALYAAARFKVPIYGATHKHNTTVLRLMQDPCAFDAVLPKKPESLGTRAMTRARQLFSLG